MRHGFRQFCYIFVIKCRETNLDVVSFILHINNRLALCTSGPKENDFFTFYLDEQSN